MQILNPLGTALPVVQSRAIVADLAALDATEVAGFWFWLPKPSEPVEWPGFKLYVAADHGMFTYEATAGWGEPRVSADNTIAEAWRLEGSFRQWAQFQEISVSLITAWDGNLGRRRPQRTFSSVRPLLDVPEPPVGLVEPGSDQAAWGEFVRACIERAPGLTIEHRVLSGDGGA
jgi:hypothetical protein